MSMQPFESGSFVDITAPSKTAKHVSAVHFLVLLHSLQFSVNQHKKSDTNISYRTFLL